MPAPSIPTHCPYCALQCGMSLRGARGGLRVESRDFPTNRGGLRQKGWTSAELLVSAERLTTPLVRAHRAAPLEPASWDEALAKVAAGLRRVESAYGRDAVAVFGGGGLTNEKAYALGKLARVALGTPNIDYNGRFCMSSAAAAGMRAFGVDRGLPFPLSDLAAADAILLVGSNAAETMPPFTRWLSDQQAPLGPRALLVMGSNVAVSAPASGRIRRRLRRWTSSWCVTWCRPRRPRPPTWCFRSLSGPRSAAR